MGGAEELGELEGGGPKGEYPLYARRRYPLQEALSDIEEGVLQKASNSGGDPSIPCGKGDLSHESTS